MNLVLLGPPGAGKGTQATRIASAFGLVHLSSGDILRAERKSMTDLGKKAQDYMDRGVLVPDDLILTMMMDHISRPDAAKGFLLDGFPRTVPQAEGLDARLATKAKKIDAVVNMVIDDAEVTRRLTGRWSCPKDGRIYHEVFSPPKKGGVCDDCGTGLTRRKDDEPAVVGQRLKTYHDETEPLAAYYRKRGVLRSVDAAADVDRVTVSIKEVCKA
ncbi:MAG TPA: adenylate kinase [Phycisphaerae bacterium]|nr:adenylate kinase [Phycisphaerae bacterium]